MSEVQALMAQLDAAKARRHPRTPGGEMTFHEFWALSYGIALVIGLAVYFFSGE